MLKSKLFDNVSDTKDLIHNILQAQLDALPPGQRKKFTEDPEWCELYDTYGVTYTT